jgi:cobyrinic acid a,c-diamide synthase
MLPIEVVERLASHFLRYADLGQIERLASSRPYPARIDSDRAARVRPFRVAYAMDEAFGAYFPDTLETLEMLGAELVEFSPLADETLPEAADLVMIGCGCPDRFAGDLAENVSLIACLKHHVCRGRRIYAEGGGTAYLGRFLHVGDRTYQGAGILPIDAVLRDRPRGPTPVCRTLTRDSWLGPSGTIVRGYRSGRWTIQAAPEPGDCPAQSGPLVPQRELLFRHHAIGSLIHLHLASLPDVVRAFAGPHRPSLALPNRPVVASRSGRAEPKLGT